MHPSIQATAVTLCRPLSVVFDSLGNAYFADSGQGCIRKVSTNGIVSAFAGIGGSFGYFGDGGAATAALLNSPYGFVFDGSGDLVLTDTKNWCSQNIQ